MHIQFLLEDQSSEKLIQALMAKLQDENSQITYNCKAFQGIGGFTKKNTVKETRTGKLLNDLATYLRGFNKSLQNIPSAIFVILDNDDNNTEDFRRQLETVAIKNDITVDHIFCIAVEEVEAWLLGDETALAKAYPNAKLQILHTYEQDSICGTWELLAEAIYPGGLKRMKKDCPSYREIGKEKAKWAEMIGVHMSLDSNQSPSFHFLITELRKRINAC
nr:DUF4276 family protein [Butyricicoccus faecihominis]